MAQVQSYRTTFRLANCQLSQQVWRNKTGILSKSLRNSFSCDLSTGTSDTAAFLCTETRRGAPKHMVICPESKSMATRNQRHPLISINIHGPRRGIRLSTSRSKLQRRWEVRTNGSVFLEQSKTSGELVATQWLHFAAS